MMKRFVTVNLVGLFLLGMAAGAFAKPRIYKWVEDKRVSSNDVLRKSQYLRVVPMSEAQTLAVVKRIMTDELYMALAQYHTTRHQMDAETTPDTVLPEEVVRQAEFDLIDENYRFILKVKLKPYGNRTRVTAKAVPVYRIRDAEAEEARDDDDTVGGNSIEVKVQAGRGSVVALGPIVIAPILGFPGDYGIRPLPEAQKRAGEIVKSFNYFMDQHLKGLRSNAPSDEGSEVNIKVKSAY